MVEQKLRKKEGMRWGLRVWRLAPRWLALVWVLWALALFGSYFYHMLTLPDRWEKIVDLFQRLTG